MKFVLAEPTHEPELRRLMAEDPMPGAFRLAYTREPDFRQALDVQGTSTQVLTALEGDRVVGMGVRAILPVHLNGHPQEVGYLGGLRSLVSARRGLGLARGFRFLRELHADGRVPGYLTTVLEDNAHALAMLQSGRAGLPRYLDLGRFTTHVLFPSRRSPHPMPQGLRIVSPPQIEMTSIVAFLREHAPRRPFGPVFGDELTGPWYRDFRPEDLFVALQGDQIVGVTGRWDQSRYKQVRVAGYAPWLRMARPLLNLALRGAGYGSLPPVGACLQPQTLAFTTLRDDHPAVFQALVGAVLQKVPTLLLVGLHERDPLAPALQAFRTLAYAARLCWVCWDDGLDFFRHLDLTAAPVLELARL